MKRSLKRSLSLVFIAGAVLGGFFGGKMFGKQMRQAHGRVLAWNDSHAFDSALDDSNAEVPPAELFRSVLDKVQHDYVGSAASVSDARLSNGALSRMFASLNDPRTTYLDPTLYQAREEALKGSFYGIGAALAIVVTHKEDVDFRYLTVQAVMPGSPAEKAGLQPGDHLTELNGHWIIAYSVLADYDRALQKTRAEAQHHPADPSRQANHVVTNIRQGLTVSKALPLLLTGKGKPLQLTVERNGQAAPFHIRLTTGLTRVNPVTYQVLDKRVGYLQVRQFNAQAASAVEKALDGLDTDLKGLIVDLRGNPGGVKADAKSGVDGYDCALTLLSHLTPGGTVGILEARPGRRSPVTLQAVERPVSLPLVVLIDAGTANLSELVAAGLHDRRRARLIGAHTFGDDVLPLFAGLKGNGGVEIDTAHLFTASGVDLNRGLRPDIPIDAHLSDTHSDPALKRALRALLY